jgi:hypothetical protein
MEFKGITLLQHVNDGIGFCINEDDEDIILKRYFYLSKDKEMYYLYNPMYTIFKIDGIDDV